MKVITENGGIKARSVNDRAIEHSIIVDRLASCKSISEISYFDVNLSLFCDKHNLYSFDSFAAPLIENESIADIILGKSYEARRQQEEIIKKCVDKIRSMENEIIIDNTHQSKYNIYLRGSHEFEVYFGNHKHMIEHMKHAVAILDAPGIIFTTDSIQFNNKTISYSDVDYGKSNDRVRFIYDTVNNHSFEQSFDTKKVNINKLRELFEGLAQVTVFLSSKIVTLSPKIKPYVSAKG